VQLATLVAEPPQGSAWLHEIKFDGYRFVAAIENGAPRFLSRNGVEWTGKFPTLGRELTTLPSRSAVLDGEIVILTPSGISDFEALKDALSKGFESDLFYFVFDLLYLDGADLRERPLLERKRLLQKLLEPGVESPHVRYSGHVEGGGSAFYRRACELGLEGAVSKRKDGPYRPGRGLDWLKVKCLRRQEFVIGGFTESDSFRGGFGALVLGHREPQGLVYVGRVGTGFTTKTLEDLRARLSRLERPTSPFSHELPREDRQGVHWVDPELVAEVSYSTWTRDRRLRHPSFVRLRGITPPPGGSPA
jgi:bifunctional non-homologous end joining protein LigD